jgi:hypothetical protein
MPGCLSRLEEVSVVLREFDMILARIEKTTLEVTERTKTRKNTACERVEA